MNVKDAIKYLSGLPEDEEIVIAWWDYECFQHMCTKEEWEQAVYRVGKWMDWSRAHESIEQMIEESKRDN